MNVNIYKRYFLPSMFTQIILLNLSTIFNSFTYIISSLPNKQKEILYSSSTGRCAFSEGPRTFSQFGQSRIINVPSTTQILTSTQHFSIRSFQMFFPFRTSSTVSLSKQLFAKYIMPSFSLQLSSTILVGINPIPEKQLLEKFCKVHLRMYFLELSIAVSMDAYE